MLGRTHALNYLRSLEKKKKKGTKVCPRRTQSEQGYKLFLAKEKHCGQAVKIGEEAQQLYKLLLGGSFHASHNECRTRCP